MNTQDKKDVSFKDGMIAFGEIQRLPASELETRVAELKKVITTKAHNIVHEIFPQKVLYLDNIYKNHTGLNCQLHEVQNSSTDHNHGATPNKKRKVAVDDMVTEDLTMIPSNQLIVDLIALLKVEVLQLIEMINTVKIWIQLNIPRIEDGNNFGVSIQEETVSELSRAEESGFSLLDSITKYFVTRAKLTSKTVKFPQIADYKQSIVELDEKEFINLRLCCLDLRNNYAILHDMIIKNLEKLKTPRSSNHMASIF